jgi:spermidine export protein MdtJ
MSAFARRNGAVWAWICLFVAIATEVLGTSFMAEAAREGGYVGYLVMAVALALSYYFLALSIRHITVGVAYAVWEGVGVMLLTLVGVLVFKDVLSIQDFIGVAIAIVGIVCVALGEEHAS